MKTHHSRQPRGRPSFRPTLDHLEDRWVPSCDITVSGATVRVENCNDRGDTIAIRDNGDGDLSVTATGAAATTAADIRNIRINSRGGDDRVSYRQTANRTRSMDINVFLGDGQDLFTGRIQGNLNNRTLDIDVDGEGGADGLDLFANADVDIAANGTFLVRMVGGGFLDFSPDRVTFGYRGDLDGTLGVNLDGGAGDETGTGSVSAIILGDAGSSGRVGSGPGTATVAGNLGDDNLTFTIRGVPIFVNTTVDGGGVVPFFGSDICTFTSTTVLTRLGCETEVGLLV